MTIWKWTRQSAAMVVRAGRWLRRQLWALTIHTQCWMSHRTTTVFKPDTPLRAFEKVRLALMQNLRSINYDVGHLLGERVYPETFLCCPVETLP